MNCIYSFHKVGAVGNNSLFYHETFIKILEIVGNFFISLIAISLCRTSDPGLVALVDCDHDRRAGYRARGQEARDPRNNVVTVNNVQNV